MTGENGLKLGEVLCQEGLIQLQQLNEALELQKSDKRKLGELMVGKGWLDGQSLTKSLAKMFGLPYIELREYTPDDAILKLIPLELMQETKIIPVTLRDNCLLVAMSDPLNISALQEVQYKSGYLVSSGLAVAEDIDKHIKGYAQSKYTSGTAKSTQGEGVVKLVEAILSKAIKERASDIHFAPQKDKLRVRFRIDGMLYDRDPINKDLERNVISRLKILARMDVTESRKPQDGRMSFAHELGDYDIRFSSLPDVLGENLVLRLLTKEYYCKSFEDLGMDQQEISVMEKIVNRPYGLILVTGPTGAGKTTTLYSILSQLNKCSRNIISVEDPVEYEMEGITQTAINSYKGYTFATAIRHILRHDPDVIMVGEIRDVETAEMAIRAALTGHLVLSTIHTNNAAGAITRLLDMNIEPFLISSAVHAVIAQRLVRVVCPLCKKEYTPDNLSTRDLSPIISAADSSMFVKSAGCESCLQTGYVGRSAIYEILTINADIRAMILKSANEAEIMATALEQGLRTIKHAGLAKVSSQITTLDEYMRVTALE